MDPDGVSKQSGSRSASQGGSQARVHAASQQRQRQVRAAAALSVMLWRDISSISSLKVSWSCLIQQL